MINLAPLVLTDGLYRGPPVLDGLGMGAAVGGRAHPDLGLIKRRNRSLLRMGYDSIAVLARR